ncbi:MAG: class I SAM-dependent methyltransferase [Ignavibacteria bacterium]|nr:class I SAM-dependent methyltransferase [Ignavibacteria bacterium]
MGEEKKINFDDYVDSYKKEIQKSISFSGQDVDFFIELKAVIIQQLAEKYFSSHEKLKVLDIGCGIGLIDSYLSGYFNCLYGTDVEKGIIEKASESNPAVKYTLYDGNTLPYEDLSFDICFAVNVIHHVPPVKWQNFVNEMFRVLNKGGLAMIFEHNPFNPLTRKVVKSCEFDKDAVLLHHREIKNLVKKAGFVIAETAYIIFFPFRSVFFRKAEQFMKWLPLGAQQYVVGRKHA